LATNLLHDLMKLTGILRDANGLDFVFFSEPLVQILYAQSALRSLGLHLGGIPRFLREPRFDPRLA
jgi:DNA-binding transcriptional MerR regulator